MHWGWEIGLLNSTRRSRRSGKRSGPGSRVRTVSGAISTSYRRSVSSTGTRPYAARLIEPNEYGGRSMNDLAYISAGEALDRFRSRDLSPVELMTAVIERSQEVEPRVN